MLRVWIRGSEDLGGGLRAFFTLEMGFDTDTGNLNQGEAIFGRQAFVGVSDTWGELTPGRQMGSLYWLGQGFVPFGISGAGPSAPTIGGFAGGYEPFRGAGRSDAPPAAGATGSGDPARLNNSVCYASPNWIGLQGTALIGLGEVAGSTSGNRTYDLSLRYTVAAFDG